MRFDAADGQTLFLKLLDAQRGETLRCAEQVASWLGERGVDVVCACIETALPDGRQLWGYPYHFGRAPAPTEQDLMAVGGALGRLHQRLAEHPHKKKWLQNTDHRLARLTALRHSLAQGKILAGPHPDKLQRLASDTCIHFEPQHHGEAACRTALHGDLNLFNMLMADGHCTFLDFEDVFHSVMPPVFDLATVFERVVVVEGASVNGDRLLTALLGAYEETSGIRVDPRQVAPALRGLALRALCTLAGSDPAGHDDKEWRKFFHLMDLSA